MGKLWLNNEIVDRLAMLQQTEAEHPGINQVAIEKDWWVTVTLKALFQTDCRDFLIFKGGTSLSKGFNIIERFSEDIDLAINHSFFGIEGTSKSQREKLRKKARAYIHETLSSQLDARLKEMGVSGYSIENVSQEQDKNGEWRLIDSDKDPSVILLHYPSILEDTINYIPPRVKIEISCLSLFVCSSTFAYVLSISVSSSKSLRKIAFACKNASFFDNVKHILRKLLSPTLYTLSKIVSSK